LLLPLLPASASAVGLLVSDNGTGKVWSVDTTSSPSSGVEKITGLGNPWGVAEDPAGNIYVAQLGASRVSKYSSAGTLVKEDWIVSSASPLGLAFAPNGNLAVGWYYPYPSNVTQHDASGVLQNTVTLASQIQGISYDADGNVYAAAGGTPTVLKYDALGAQDTSFTNNVNASGPFTTIETVWVSGSAVYASGGSWVFKFGLDGNKDTTFGGGSGVILASGANGIAVIGNALYVARGTYISKYNASTGDLVEKNFATGFNNLTLMTTSDPLGAPMNLTAQRGDGEAYISFDNPASDGGSPITDYEYRLDGGSWFSAESTASPIRIVGLTNGTTYQVTLRAVNSYGAGTESATVSVTPGATTLLVTHTDDTDDGTCDTQHCSLRDAIAAASPYVTDTIQFDASLQEGTIRLDSWLRPYLKSLIIDGLGRGITITTDQNTRLFLVANSTVTLRGLTLSNPGTDNSGGALYLNSSSNVTVERCLFSANNSNSDGGALYSYGGTLTVTDSHFTNNRAVAGGMDGGAIYGRGGTTTVQRSSFIGNLSDGGSAIRQYGGTLTVINSTFSDNTSLSKTRTDTGTIRAWGTLTVLNSTLAYNTMSQGGAIALTVPGPTTLTLNNVLLAYNTRQCAFSGNTATGSNNLSTDATCTSGGFTQVAEALIDTVGDYGGATTLPDGSSHTRTVPLLPGSPAIDAGNATTCADPNTVNALDQRGVVRPQVTACDIGAFESQGFTFTKTGDNQSATINTAFATPLSVTVTATGSGEPVDDGMVTFIAPGSGASATLSTTYPVAIVGGSASVTATANATAGGPYTVMASARGVATADVASFSLTNITIPDAPTNVTATAGNEQATVSWTAPASTGGAAISGYTVTGSPSGTCTTTGTTSCTVTGLNNGTAYTFTVTATNSAGTGPASTASNSVTPLATSASGSTPGGPVTATITGGTCLGYANGSAQFTVPTNPPAGQTFPYGVFGFTVLECATGGTVTITLSYPQPLPDGTRYWKNIGGTWVDWTNQVTITGNTIVLTITDGGEGDTNPNPGQISDPSGPAFGGGPTPIPTLSEWGLILVGLAMLAMGWRRERRRMRPARR